MSVGDFLAEKGARTDAFLRTYLETWTGAPRALVEAVEYSLFAGGKRFRPALVLGTAEMIRGDDSVALPAAAAIEMIHTYSLVHDDLPAMDNDDFRRGRPSLHKARGEALAILAGDALLTMAFDLAAQTEQMRVIREVARAAGAAGMVGGQVLDIESGGQDLSIEALRNLHARKTGALIRASVRCGAILADADDAQLEALTVYAERIGLAFQIADDLLDVVGDPAALGKSVGKDAAQHKATYPALLGLDGARELARRTIDAALAALAEFGPEAGVFRGLAAFILARER